MLTLDQIIKKSVKLIEMDVKLVEYSESSESSGEDAKNTDSRKIAVVQPVQHQQTVPEPISENPLETTQPEHELNPDHSSPPTEHPEAELFTTDEYSETPLEIEIPEPEVIELSSDSNTVSFITDTTLGE